MTSTTGPPTHNSAAGCSSSEHMGVSCVQAFSTVAPWLPSHHTCNLPGASAIVRDTAPLWYFKLRQEPNWVSHVPHLPLSPASSPPRARHTSINIGLAVAGRYMGWCCPRKITIGQITFRFRSTKTLFQLLLQPNKPENKKYKKYPLATPRHRRLCSENI